VAFLTPTHPTDWGILLFIRVLISFPPCQRKRVMFEEGAGEGQLVLQPKDHRLLPHSRKLFGAEAAMMESDYRYLVSGSSLEW